MIIFLILEVLFQPSLEPQAPTRERGGDFPPTVVARGSRGGGNWILSPPGRNLGATPPKGTFYEKCLVKYCNFIVNLDHSLCRRSDSRSYVNLRVFCPRRKPSIIYEGIVLRLSIILRDETMRE